MTEYTISRRCGSIYDWQLKLFNINYTVSQKYDTDVALYNFNADQPILIIFVRDVA